MRPVLGKHLTLDYGSWVPRRRMIGRSSSLMILASSARQSMSLGVAVRFYLRKGQIEKGDVALAAETGGVDDASGGVV